MKKLNKKGFTLIELLAVITIMGILMLVAIPAVSRTIENTRRDTFVSTAKSYINALKNSIAADEVSQGGEPISAADEGYYYYPFTTVQNNESATDLMEQGGKSSWGNADVHGYIAVYKTIKQEGNDDDDDDPVPNQGEVQTGDNNPNTDESNQTNKKYSSKTKYEYAILIIDKTGHGTNTLTKEKELKRSAIVTKVKNAPEWNDGAVLVPGGNKYDSFDDVSISSTSSDENQKAKELKID